MLSKKSNPQYSFEISENFEIALDLIYEKSSEFMMAGRLVLPSIKSFGKEKTNGTILVSKSFGRGDPNDLTHELTLHSQSLILQQF
jgi:hypothetical protein